MRLVPIVIDGQPRVAIDADRVILAFDATILSDQPKTSIRLVGLDDTLDVHAPLADVLAAIEGTSDPADDEDAARREWAADMGGVDEPNVAPAPSSPQPSPADLLASGARLRFVRDAGAMGEVVPAVVDAFVSDQFRDEDDDIAYMGLVGRAGASRDGIAASYCFASDWSICESLAAERLVALLDSLGYRFASVVDDPGGAA